MYLSIYNNLELFQELFSDLGHANDSFDKETCDWQQDGMTNTPDTFFYSFSWLDSAQMAD